MDIIEWFGGQRGPGLNAVMIGFTLSGNFSVTIPLFIIFIAALLKDQRKRLALKFTAVLVILNLVTLLIKMISVRDRPHEISWLVHPIGTSFPSGHSLVAVTFYGMIIMTLGKTRTNWYKFLAPIWISFALLMGISRIYTGVHYPSDVVAGLGISFAVFPLLQYIISEDMNRNGHAKCPNTIRILNGPGP